MRNKLYWRWKLKIPRLTARASRRMDQVLMTLPDRNEAAAPRSDPLPSLPERHAPAHYAPKKKHRYKAPAEKPQPTAETDLKPARRWPGVLGGLAATLAALALVSLPVMNWLFPRFAETIPGLGVVFQALNHPRSEKPQPIPMFPETPETSAVPPLKPSYHLTLADSQVLGGFLLLDLRLTPLDGALPDAERLTTGWNGEEGLSVTVNGNLAELYNAVTFDRAGESFQGRALLRLPEDFRPAGRTTVEIQIDRLYTVEESVSLLSAAPVEGAFEIPGVSTLALDDYTAAVMDNGVGLGEIHYQPGEGTLSLTLSAPVLTKEMNLYVWTVTDDGTVVGCVVEDEVREEGRQRFYYRWEDLPEGAERMTLLVSPDYHDFNTVWSGGTLLAEFTVELAEEAAYVTESYPYLGYEKIEIATVLALLEAGPRFGEDHLALLEQSAGLRDGEDSHRMNPSMQFVLASDLDTSLPLEAVVFLDGSEWISTPLGTEYASKTEQGWSRTMDGAGLDIFRWEAPLEEDLPWISGFVRRAYSLTVWFDPGVESPDDFWTEHEIALRFRDPATGREFAPEPPSAGLFQGWESAERVESSPVPEPTPDPAEESRPAQEESTDPEFLRY